VRSRGLALLRRVTNRFDVVAVEVDHVAAVVALVVTRPEPWLAVVRSSCGERGGVERVDRRWIGRLAEPQSRDLER